MIKSQLLILIFVQSIFIGLYSQDLPPGIQSLGEDQQNDTHDGITAQFPSQLFKCPANKKKIIQTNFLSKETYKQIVIDLKNSWELQQKLVKNDEDKTKNLNVHFAACILRYAGHDFMDFRKNDKDQYGSDGCINFEDEDNKGIPECVIHFRFNELYARWCDKISLADFGVLVAEAALGLIDKDVKNFDEALQFKEGKLLQRFMNNFKYGRKTNENCHANDRMPIAIDGCSGSNGVENVLVKNVYGSFATKEAWRMTAAISGAHTIGGLGTETNATWVHTWSAQKFDNYYYKNMVMNSWIQREDRKDIWVRGGLRSNSSFVKKLLMLSSDMCLFWKINPSAIKHAKLEGKCDMNMTACDGNQNDVFIDRNHPAEQCCAWITDNILEENGILKRGENQDMCGFPFDECPDCNRVDQRDWCCSKIHHDKFGDCSDVFIMNGPASQDIIDYAKDENLFYKDFIKAWNHGTALGQTDLGNLDQKIIKDDWNIVCENCDLKGSEFKKGNGYTLEQCQKECEQDSSCLGIDFGKNSRSGECYFNTEQNMKYSSSNKYDAYRKQKNPSGDHEKSACRENGRFDNDCCALKNQGKCISGYKQVLGEPCYRTIFWTAYKYFCLKDGTSSNNQNEGRCLENKKPDDDCCALKKKASCDAGFKISFGGVCWTHPIFRWVKANKFKCSK